MTGRPDATRGGHGGPAGSPRPVFVEDSVLVLRPVEDVVSVLSCGSETLLGDSLVGTGTGVHEARVGPLRSSAALGRAVEIRPGPLRRHGTAVLLAFSWRPTGAAPLLPDFDADLEVRPVDLDRSLLTLRGRYHPPGGRIGRGVDHLVGHHLAEATIRSFLAGLADRLAEGPRRRAPDGGPRRPGGPAPGGAAGTALTDPPNHSM